MVRQKCSGIRHSYLVAMFLWLVVLCWVLSVEQKIKVKDLDAYRFGVSVNADLTA